MRLLYEATPIAFSSNRPGAWQPMHGENPRKAAGKMHERTPLFRGARDDVLRIMGLMNERSWVDGELHAPHTAATGICENESVT